MRNPLAFLVAVVVIVTFLSVMMAGLDPNRAWRAKKCREGRPLWHDRLTLGGKSC